MKPLPLIDLDVAEPLPDGPFLGLRRDSREEVHDWPTEERQWRRYFGRDARAYYMDRPEFGCPKIFVFGFQRDYRTAGGYAAQGLMPAAFVLDVVTSPVQLVMWIHIANALPHY